MITSNFSGLTEISENLKDWADLEMPVDKIEKTLIKWLESKIESLTEDIEDNFDRDYEGLKALISKAEYDDNGNEIN
jgi:hypothetical protein